VDDEPKALSDLRDGHARAHAYSLTSAPKIRAPDTHYITPAEPSVMASITKRKDRHPSTSPTVHVLVVLPTANHKFLDRAPLRVISHALPNVARSLRRLESAAYNVSMMETLKTRTKCSVIYSS
jgi:hypothetical protein